MPKAYQPERDIRNLTDKVIFITGGTAGLGLATIEALLPHQPAQVYVLARSPTKAETVLEPLRAAHPGTIISVIEGDLGSLASIAHAARTFLAVPPPRLDVLIANAGILLDEPSLTSDGYEVHIGTNHLSHALLIQLLLPTLRATAAQPGADVRIVLLTSQAYRVAPNSGVDFARSRTTMAGVSVGHLARYGMSKLANLQYAAELARRYPDVLSVSVHPGVVDTTMMTSQRTWMRAFIWLTQLGDIKTAAEGAWNQLWAATSTRDGIRNGAYYEPVGKLVRLSGPAADETMARTLWEWTEKELEKWTTPEEGPEGAAKE